MKDRKELNRHDFSGMCAPDDQGVCWSKTFSVGIFKWVPKSNPKKELKKTAVIHRVKGPVSQAERVYEVAGNTCDILDAGGIMRSKSTSI